MSRIRNFDRAVAERLQPVYRGGFASKKHLSGGPNYWCYGSTSAIRRGVAPVRLGLRRHSQDTVLERPYSCHYQQILTTYEQ